MKHRIWSFSLIALAFVLGISLALSCSGTTTQNGNTEWGWQNTPAGVLARDAAVRLEDLPPGWHLWEAEGGPSCDSLFSTEQQAYVWLRFCDQNAWDDEGEAWRNGARRSVRNTVALRWPEQAGMFVGGWREGSVATNITGADEARIKVLFTEIGEPAVNCTYGVDLRFKKGLYEVIIITHNRDLRDLCIEQGPAVDAEIAFVTDLAVKLASRIS